MELVWVVWAIIGMCAGFALSNFATHQVMEDNERQLEHYKEKAHYYCLKADMYRRKLNDEQRRTL